VRYRNSAADGRLDGAKCPAVCSLSRRLYSPPVYNKRLGHCDVTLSVQCIANYLHVGCQRFILVAETEQISLMYCKRD